MTSFRTEIKLASQQQNVLDHQSKVLLLGSCFSENIGNKLSYYQFNTVINPFGTLFSPTAIAKVLEDTVNEKTYIESELIKQGEFFHSLHHHSDLSGLATVEVIANIHKAQQKCLAQLKSATHVVITLGTSWVYGHLLSNQLVANCHKIPQTEFDKRMLSLQEIEVALEDITKNIRKVNSSTQIIFTVSPVRHTKDGLIENSLSKAQLLTATHKIKESHNVAYFGSYEIMMDDLRDYRFYESDMIHPNEVAINYIWEQFSKVWISEKAQSYFKRIASVQQSKLHKPFQENSVSHQEFLKKLAVKQSQLEKELNVKF
ncbi:GSCFA domain-containing protein [Wenyingzhuangia fucanilytica]|uniref:GSCFA domain-containing protein n=1 Tax=Wenyingzhuangia fucanilytica TaxID=1790137 RepID=A0A1B1Y703_9FLAO|nr:GSCFA domain-containing protein [Wenyingzhuangia fucanilytica]ANW96545.1 GSCFA domain-containing protein [Wenyingzhuangia fucanilytica]